MRIITEYVWLWAALAFVLGLVVGHLLYEAHLARLLLKARQAAETDDWDRASATGMFSVLRLSASEVFDLGDRSPVQRQFLLRGMLRDAGFDLGREIHEEKRDWDGSVVYFQEKVEEGTDLDI